MNISCLTREKRRHRNVCWAMVGSGFFSLPYIIERNISINNGSINNNFHFILIIKQKYKSWNCVTNFFLQFWNSSLYFSFLRQNDLWQHGKRRFWVFSPLLHFSVFVKEMEACKKCLLRHVQCAGPGSEDLGTNSETRAVTIILHNVESPGCRDVDRKSSSRISRLIWKSQSDKTLWDRRNQLLTSQLTIGEVSWF